MTVYHPLQNSGGIKWLTKVHKSENLRYDIMNHPKKKGGEFKCSIVESVIFVYI